ncbi:MAG: hypothetical protein NXI31_24940 [bacterium]|nr:hypothetical protein [bacterium]
MRTLLSLVAGTGLSIGTLAAQNEAGEPGQAVEPVPVRVIKAAKSAAGAKAPAEGTLQKLEDALLGGGPTVERIEFNGVMHEVRALRRPHEDPDLAPCDIAWCAFESLILDTLRADLVRQGKWPDDEAFAAAWADYCKPYDDTPFSVEVIATRFKGYPDLDTYRERWRVQHAYVTSLGKGAFAPQALQAEVSNPTSGAHLRGDGVTAELWFHPAVAGPDGRRDFDAAGRLAARTRAAIAAGAELPDGAEHRVVGKGKRLTINQLRSNLGENEYLGLVREGAAAKLFDPQRAPLGELVGPWRAPTGVYLARVTDRHVRDTPIDVEVLRMRKLVRQLAEQRQFRIWTGLVLARSVIRVPR